MTIYVTTNRRSVHICKNRLDDVASGEVWGITSTHPKVNARLPMSAEYCACCADCKALTQMYLPKIWSTFNVRGPLFSYSHRRTIPNFCHASVTVGQCLTQWRKTKSAFVTSQVHKNVIFSSHYEPESQ